MARYKFYIVLYWSDAIRRHSAALCACRVDSRQDEEHNAELSSRLRIIRRQEDDAIREHRAFQVSSTACLLSLDSVRVVFEIIRS